MISSAYYYSQTDFLIYTTIYVHIRFQSSHLFYLLFCCFKKEPGRSAIIFSHFRQMQSWWLWPEGKSCPPARRGGWLLTSGGRRGAKGRLWDAQFAASVTGEIFLFVINRLTLMLVKLRSCNTERKSGQISSCKCDLGCKSCRLTRQDRKPI